MNKPDELIHRFLLDKLSAEERADIEARFLADNEFFETMLAAESSLIDKYLRGELSGDDLQRAQKLFESSETQRGEVEFTRGLLTALRPANLTETVEDVAIDKSATVTDRVPRSLLAASSQSSPWLFRVTTFATLALCLCLFGLVLFLYKKQSDSEAKRLAAEKTAQEIQIRLREQSSTNAELAKQLELEKQQRAKAEDLVAQMQFRSSNDIVSAILEPTTADRGGASNIINIKAQSKGLQLRLELDDDSRQSRRYAVALTTVEGRTVWRKELDARQVRQGRLNLTLPAALFSYDDYRIELKALSDTGELLNTSDYIFRVRK